MLSDLGYTLSFQSDSTEIHNNDCDRAIVWLANSFSGVFHKNFIKYYW